MMSVTNDGPEKWEARDKGVMTHYVFEVKGMEHAKQLYSDLCLHFEQPERIKLFHGNGVNTGRQLYFVVKVTLGRE
jgi:hypothetical protein